MGGNCKPCMWLLGLMLLLPALSNAAPLPPMIDSHAHYTAADAAEIPASEVISKLDAAGVRWIVVSGSPPALAQQLARQLPGRVIPLLGAYDGGIGKANWLKDKNLPKRVAAQLRGSQWAGIGELHLFAGDADNSVFEQLALLAESHGLVLMIHGDAEVIEHVFALAPRSRVLWAHLGTRPEPDLLASMLVRYPSLWIDTSVRDDRIAPDGQLLSAWRELFLRHPDRFLVAVDTFSVNRWQHYETVARQIRSWANTLPGEVKRNLLHDNAQRLFRPYIEKASGARRNLPSDN